MSDGYIEHRVAEGEDLASIALRYRVSAEEIWQDPKNQQSRKTRENEWRQKFGRLQENPYVLQPDDVLFIPPYQPKKVSIQTDKRHVFRRTGLLEPFILFLKHGEQPRAGVDYTLRVADGKYRQNQVFNGTTGVDGKLEHWIDTTSPTALLEITADPEATPIKGDEGETLAEPESYNFLLRHLDPVATDAGVRARLQNLGYLNSTNAGDSELAAAIHLFHQDCQLKPSFVVTADTREWLVKKHQS